MDENLARAQNDGDQTLDRAIHCVVCEPVPCEVRERVIETAASWTPTSLSDAGAGRIIRPFYKRTSSLLRVSAIIASLLLLAFVGSYFANMRKHGPDVAKIDSPEASSSGPWSARIAASLTGPMRLCAPQGSVSRCPRSSEVLWARLPRRGGGRRPIREGRTPIQPDPSCIDADWIGEHDQEVVRCGDRCALVGRRLLRCTELKLGVQPLVGAIAIGMEWAFP